MTTGDLSRETGVSDSHLRRLASAREIPGAVKRAGKHFRFRDCPALTAWIRATRDKADRRALAKDLEYTARSYRSQNPPDMEKVAWAKATLKILRGDGGTQAAKFNDYRRILAAFARVRAVARGRDAR